LAGFEAWWYACGIGAFRCPCPAGTEGTCDGCNIFSEEGEINTTLEINRHLHQLNNIWHENFISQTWLFTTPPTDGGNCWLAAAGNVGCWCCTLAHCPALLWGDTDGTEAPLGVKAEKLPKLGAAAGTCPADQTDELSSLLGNVITQPLQYVYHHLGLLKHEKVKILAQTIGTVQIQVDLNLR